MIALAANPDALSAPAVDLLGGIKLPALDNTYGALLLGTALGLM